MGQLQLLNGQQTNNHNLQQYLNQSVATQQHHVDVLHQLITSNYQMRFNYMFASITVFDGSKKEEFLSG